MGKKVEALKKTSDSLYTWIGIIVDFLAPRNSTALRRVGMILVLGTFLSPYVLTLFGQSIGAVVFIVWLSCMFVSLLVWHWFSKAADYIERRDDC